MTKLDRDQMFRKFRTAQELLGRMGPAEALKRMRLPETEAATKVVTMKAAPDDSGFVAAFEVVWEKYQKA